MTHLFAALRIARLAGREGVAAQDTAQGDTRKAKGINTQSVVATYTPKVETVGN